MKRVYVYKVTNKTKLESKEFRRLRLKKTFPFIEVCKFKFKHEVSPRRYIVADNKEDALERYHERGYARWESGDTFPTEVYFPNAEIRIRKPIVSSSCLEVELKENASIDFLKENLWSMDFIKYVTCYQEIYKNWMIEE